MQNFYGQELTIGSIVCVGYRRAGANYRQVGTIVRLEEKTVESWRKTDKFWSATVVWVAHSGYETDSSTRPLIFQSQWAVRDLLLIDAESLAPHIVQAIDTAYEEYIFKQEPSDFIPEHPEP